MELTELCKESFMRILVNSRLISKIDKKEIIRTFYWRYRNNERFRCSLRGYFLVFIDNKYVGLHNNGDTLSFTERYRNVFTIPIHPSS